LPNSKISRTTPETQEESTWSPPVGTLGELVAEARRRSDLLNARLDLESVARLRGDVPKLSTALQGDNVAVIAEIKRSSPSKGVINSGIDSGALAEEYAAGGASAISVLTERSRFGGSDDDIARVRVSVRVPILKKDFHVTESQIAHAAATGASAALGIVRAIKPGELDRLSETARRASIELVYEVRDELELERALEDGAQIIGVNNRNLETLEIDRATVPRILPLIPRECIAIAESGYSSREEIEAASQAGADAVLVGSFLSASTNPRDQVHRLASIPRNKRSS